jgi:hypothetical protein
VHWTTSVELDHWLVKLMASRINSNSKGQFFKNWRYAILTLTMCKITKMPSTQILTLTVVLCLIRLPQTRHNAIDTQTIFVASSIVALLFDYSGHSWKGMKITASINYWMFLMHYFLIFENRYVISSQHSITEAQRNCNDPLFSSQDYNHSLCIYSNLGLYEEDYKRRHEIH